MVRPRRSSPPKPAPKSAPPAPPAPLPRAAWLVLALLVGAAIAAVVSFGIYDTDVWEHLTVGKAIWLRRTIPHVQWWVWPTYGQPDVLPSWLFRVLLWPFWRAGGVTGLFAWRWLTTLLAFALLWAAARRAGARGPWVLLALFWCALFWRYRSQPRPETLVAVILAAQMLVLEARRAGGPRPLARDPVWALAPLALLWANTHMSYYMGIALDGFYLLDALLPRRRAADRTAPRAFALALAASVAASFVNPFGWVALAQPLDYWRIWRHEPIYRIIGELKPVVWAVYVKSWLPLWLAALGSLALWRWRRRGFDLAEALVLAAFVPQALMTQRFLGYVAVLVAPFLARDLDGALADVRWPAALRGPWAQVALVLAGVAVLWAPTVRDESLRPEPVMRWENEPVRACDWIAAHGVRGRSFNPFEYGGYLLFRFWPEPDRLPFMDIHQGGTPRDRSLAAYALVQPEAWAQLDAERRFDWLLLTTQQYEGEHVLETVQADTATWALVFTDDAGSLFLRRSGPMAALAERERYRVLRAGILPQNAVMRRCVADTALRVAALAEARRAVASSPWNGLAAASLGDLQLLAGDATGAGRSFARAAGRQPELYRVHERFGTALLLEQRPAEALAEYRIEQRIHPETPILDLRCGQALRALGRRDEARAAFQRALRFDLTRGEAQDSLAALDRR